MADEGLPSIPPSPGSGALPELTGAQKALYETLISRSGRLGRIYIGAILVLRQDMNPDRLALAAHNFRELLEKLPLYFEELPLPLEPGLPASLKPPDLLSKVRMLNEAWVRAKVVGQKSPDSRGREQQMDRYLRSSEMFFSWFEKAHPTRKVLAAKVLRRLDPTSTQLPKVIEELHVDEFEKHRKYFVAVCHHGRDVTSEDFERWRSSCERFLLDRLVPRTFEDHAIIDGIIQEGERDADS